MTKAEIFIDTYKKVEDLIRLRISKEEQKNLDGGPMKWYEDNCRQSREFKVALKNAREVRNLLSHNGRIGGEPVVIPSDPLIAFISGFRSFLAKEIHADDLMTSFSRMHWVKLTDSVIDAVDDMMRSGHRNIPVIDRGSVVMVFSQQDALTYLRNGENEKLFSDMTPETDEAGFVSKEASEATVTEKLKKSSILFVTDDGKKSGKVLGMITPEDLMKRHEIDIVT